jgi:hypothetical protein
MEDVDAILSDVLGKAYTINTLIKDYDGFKSG